MHEHRTVTLLRHGDIDAAGRLVGHTDHPLTGPGWQQMQAAQPSARAVRPLMPSPAPTLCVAQRSRGPCPMQSSPLYVLARSRFWPLGKQPYGATELPAGWADDYAAGRLTPPGGGDQWLQLRQPRTEAWQHWQSRTTGATHRALVTHGGVIRLLLAEHFRLEPGAGAADCRPARQRVRWSEEADGWPPCLLELRGPILLPAKSGDDWLR